jgi:hypothetical protein
LLVLHDEKLAAASPHTHGLRPNRPVPVVKRRDTQARRRSDTVAERPESVLSGQRLAEIV